jgi:hypothetical protein
MHNTLMFINDTDEMVEMDRHVSQKQLEPAITLTLSVEDTAAQLLQSVQHMDTLATTLKSTEAWEHNHSSCTVTGNKMWVHNYSLEKKMDTTVQKHSTLPAKKLETIGGTEMLMATICWDIHRIILIDFMLCGDMATDCLSDDITML